ncbi:MAG: sugar transferase, partial [Rhodopila sp.]|nr:sugar transferase [Rhodopila sp.]
MQRAVAHFLPREMAVLGLVEFALSFAAIYALSQAAGMSPPVPGRIEFLPNQSVVLAATLTLVIGLVALTIGLYRPEACLNRRLLLIASGLAAIVAFAVPLFIGGGPRDGFTIEHTIYMTQVLGAWLATMALIRLIYGFAIVRMSLARRVLLVGDPRQVAAFNARLRSRLGRSFDPVVLQIQDVSWQLLRQQRIWGVVVASRPADPAVESLLDCKLRGTHIFSGSAFYERYLGRIDLDALTANDLLTTEGFATGRLSATLKRLCDIVIGIALLAVTLPVMAMTAVAIKIDSAGPVFYRQRRTGRFDKPFTLFKFRSMTTDAEASGKPR